MKKQSLFLFFALTLRVSPLMRLFRHQQSSFIDVTIALTNNIITIIIIIVIAKETAPPRPQTDPVGQKLSSRDY